MKSIKLTFIFLLVLGGVVAAFYFATKRDTPKIIEIDTASLQEYRTQFEEDWKNAGDWNEEMFKSHCDLIHQLEIQNYDVVALNDMNTATAVEVVYEQIFNEWKTPTCKKYKIDNYMKAITTIEQSEVKAATNPNVVLIKQVNEVYLKAYNLSKKKLGLTPTFDGSNWNSYSSYASNVESQKSSIQNNPQYKEYLSNITEISSGLNSISSKLSSGRARFYNSLALKIRSYYEDTPRPERTRSDLSSLRNVISKYESEYSSNSSLNSFARSYADDVYENENR